jgi:hypothetical protein
MSMSMSMNAGHLDRETERVVGLLRALQAQQMDDERPHDFGPVQSYNPAQHTATVTMARGGLTGHLPIETVRGVRVPLRRGDVVRVALERGQPATITGFIHTQANGPAAADLAMEGDVYLGGSVTLGRPLYLGAVVVLPPASADLRYATCILTGDAATADVLKVCLQSATGTYSWVSVATG